MTKLIENIALIKFFFKISLKNIYKNFYGLTPAVGHKSHHHLSPLRTAFCSLYKHTCRVRLFCLGSTHALCELAIKKHKHPHFKDNDCICFTFIPHIMRFEHVS